jgi:hypothetical protein
MCGMLEFKSPCRVRHKQVSSGSFAYEAPVLRLFSALPPSPFSGDSGALKKRLDQVPGGSILES